MIDIPLSHLIALVKFDQSLNVQQNALATLQQNLDRCKGALQLLDQEAATIQQHYLENKNNVYRLEKRFDELCSERRTKEEKLSTTFNPKQYSALEHHLVVLTQEQELVEQHLEAAWQEQDQLAKTKVEKDSFYAQQQVGIKLSMKDLHDAIGLLQEELQQKTCERSVVCSAVPQELLEKYTALQEKIKDPIVPLQHTICSGCLHIVPPQKINNIFLYNLEQCHNCFRLLYAPQLL